MLENLYKSLGLFVISAAVLITTPSLANTLTQEETEKIKYILQDVTTNPLSEYFDFIDEDNKRASFKTNKSNKTKFTIFDKKIEIEKLKSIEPSYGNNPSNNYFPTPYVYSERYAYNKKKGNKLANRLEFAGDYLDLSRLSEDRRDWHKKRTYRYRFNNKFDFKVQRWKPAFEYWLNDQKTSAVQFIVWDRHLGFISDTGGPQIQYRIMFPYNLKN